MRMFDVVELDGGRVAQTHKPPAKTVTRAECRAHLEGFQRAQARSRSHGQKEAHHAAA